MIEIINKTNGPIQLIVKSRVRTRSFTTLLIPGRGSGNNVKEIEDELYTEYIDRAEGFGLISTRKIVKQLGE